MEEILWRQKSRGMWIKDSDQNTKFFHFMVSHHRRINYVEKMVIEDRMMKGNKQLRQEVKSFFCRLYLDEFNWRPQLDGISFQSLG